MKSKIFYMVLVLSIVLVGFSASQLCDDDTEADGITITHVDTTLTISGTGAMPDYTTTANLGITYTGITAVNIGTGITYVGTYAFYGCTTLQTITIADTVTTMGSAICHGCTALTSATLPINMTSLGGSIFRGCTSLVEQAIPEGITKLGSYMFYGCTALTTVTLPSTLQSMDDYGFYGCTSLVSISIPENVKSIGSAVFYGCTHLGPTVELPDGLTSLGGSNFRGCTALTSIVIPHGITSVGSYEFRDCTSLASITLSDGTTAIGQYAFYGCTALTYIYVHYGVTVGLHGTDTGTTTQIVYWVFITYVSANGNDTDKVTPNALLTAPDTQVWYTDYSGSDTWDFSTDIIVQNTILYGQDIVSNLDDIIYVYNGTTLTISGTGAMDDYTTSFNLVSVYPLMTSVVIQDGITSIGDYTFYGCTTLSSASIASSVSYIGSAVFYGCTSLHTVSFPGVTSWGGSVFKGCTSLTSVVIPSGITSISSYQFYGCTSLVTVQLPTTIDTIYNYAFYGDPIVSLFIHYSTIIGAHAINGSVQIDWWANVTLVDVNGYSESTIMDCGDLIDQPTGYYIWKSNGEVWDFSTDVITEDITLIAESYTEPTPEPASNDWSTVIFCAFILICIMATLIAIAPALAKVIIGVGGLLIVIITIFGGFVL